MVLPCYTLPSWNLTSGIYGNTHQIWLCLESPPSTMGKPLAMLAWGLCLDALALLQSSMGEEVGGPEGLAVLSRCSARVYHKNKVRSTRGRHPMITPGLHTRGVSTHTHKTISLLKTMGFSDSTSGFSPSRSPLLVHLLLKIISINIYMQECPYLFILHLGDLNKSYSLKYHKYLIFIWPQTFH